VITGGSTYDNRSNLSEKFFREVVTRYEGTRLGRQELEAAILEDVPGALWSLDMLDKTRVSERPADLQRIVVAVDPPVTSGESADECGIVVAALGRDKRGYVLADLTSHRESPAQWAARAVKAYHDFGADRMIAEVNNGGELVETVIRQIDPKISYRAVHASRGKVTRAEPISALYEQGRVSHAGTFPMLEDQMCSFTPDLDRSVMGSPDRVDALVWGMTELMLNNMGDNSVGLPVQVSIGVGNLN
jgi:phage terminase large subunit-like protein